MCARFSFLARPAVVIFIVAVAATAVALVVR